jgi:hypothetical protein
MHPFLFFTQFHSLLLPFIFLNTLQCNDVLIGQFITAETVLYNPYCMIACPKSFTDLLVSDDIHVD